MRELIEAFIKYLDCPCQYFKPMTDDTILIDAYYKAREQGKREGFVPVIVVVDESLWETLIINSGEDEDSDWDEDYAFDANKVATYRKKMLEMSIEFGKEDEVPCFVKKYHEQTQDNMMNWNTKIGGGEANNYFDGYWQYDRKNTYPLILAEIPVKHSWEVFSYLPFGNWNDCPDTFELMAMAKYWYEQYGAMPVIISSDTLEFCVSYQVNREHAMKLAVEQYGFCHYVMEKYYDKAFYIGKLADSLTQSRVWHFGWD